MQQQVLRTVAALAGAGLLAFSGAADAQCVSTNENACPTSSSTYHKVRFNIIGSSRSPDPGFRAFFGSVDFAGLDVAGGCITENGGLDWAAWTVLDEQVGSIVVSLNDDSFMCTSNGNEEITFVNAPMSTPCGTMTPLATGGYDLTLLMSSGNDIVTGPTSNYLSVCGGSGDDQISNARTANGRSGNDRITNCRGGICYGGTGSDRLVCGSFGGQCRGEANSDCVQQSTSTAPPTVTITCGTECDLTSHSSGTTSCEVNAPINCLTATLPPLC